jgi:hypothetical protein
LDRYIVPVFEDTTADSMLSNSGDVAMFVAFLVRQQMEDFERVLQVEMVVVVSDGLVRLVCLYQLVMPPAAKVPSGSSHVMMHPKHAVIETKATRNSIPVRVDMRIYAAQCHWAVSCMMHDWRSMWARVGLLVWQS